MSNYCVDCQDPIMPKARQKLGYKTCLSCGEHRAKQVKHTIVPMAKSNYIMVTDTDILKQLNPKRLGE